MPGAHSANENVWLDDQAGPVVRPYAVTRGRTQPAHGRFDLIAFVVATRPASAIGAVDVPEHVPIMDLCQRPTSVAELAAHVNLPLGTVRVLLGDLLDRGLIVMREQQPTADLPSEQLCQAVINGLRAL